MILLTPSPTLPRCGLCPAGEGDVSIVNTPKASYGMKMTIARAMPL